MYGDLVIPSYGQGYARSQSEAANPGLWNGLVGLWQMTLGTTGSELFDHSGYANNGTLENMDPGTDWVGSERGAALSFDANDQFVKVLHSPVLQPSDVVSVGIWWRSSGLVGDDGGLISKSFNEAKYFSSTANKVYELAILSDTMYWQVSDGSSNDSASSSVAGSDDGTWRFAAATFKPGECLLYFDGEPVASDASPNATGINPQTNWLDIGGGGSQYDFAGEIDLAFVFEDVVYVGFLQFFSQES